VSSSPAGTSFPMEGVQLQSTASRSAFMCRGFPSRLYLCLPPIYRTFRVKLPFGLHFLCLPCDAVYLIRLLCAPAFSRLPPSSPATLPGTVVLYSSAPPFLPHESCISVARNGYCSHWSLYQTVFSFLLLCLLIGVLLKKPRPMDLRFSQRSLKPPCFRVPRALFTLFIIFPLAPLRIAVFCGFRSPISVANSPFSLISLVTNPLSSR